MSLTAIINGHLQDLGNKTGLDGLGLDSEGFCGVVIGDGDSGTQINIEVVEEENLAAFHTTVAEATRDDQRPLYARLLAANLGGVETNGCFFAVNPANGDIVLCYSWVFESLDYGTFEQILENLYATADAWRAELAAA